MWEEGRHLIVFILSSMFFKFFTIIFLFISYSITVLPIYAPPLPSSAQPSPCSHSHWERDWSKSICKWPTGTGNDAGMDRGTFNTFFKRSGEFSNVRMTWRVDEVGKNTEGPVQWGLSTQGDCLDFILFVIESHQGVRSRGVIRSTFWFRNKKQKKTLDIQCRVMNVLHCAEWEHGKGWINNKKHCLPVLEARHLTLRCWQVGFFWWSLSLACRPDSWCFPIILPLCPCPDVLFLKGCQTYWSEATQSISFYSGLFKGIISNTATFFGTGELSLQRIHFGEIWFSL